MLGASRRVLLGIGILSAVVGFAGCSGDVTAADDNDALARDSTLKLQVLFATGDTVVTGDVVEMNTSERIAAAGASFVDVESNQTTSIGLRSDPLPQRARRAPAPVAVRPQPNPVAARPAPTPAGAELQSTARTAEPELPERAAPRVTTVSAGTEISLAAGQRICVNTSDAGDRFTARVTRNISGSGGTVIPRGARASVQVTSLVGPLGEEDIAIAVRSLTIDGETYTVASRVTDIELDRRPGAYRCIPEGGRITARVTRALRVTR